MTTLPWILGILLGLFLLAVVACLIIALLHPPREYTGPVSRKFQEAAYKHHAWDV